jgi:FkbM family methyltransferase
LLYRSLPILKRAIPSLVRLLYGKRRPGGWTLAKRDRLQWLLSAHNHVDRRYLEPDSHEAAQLDYLCALLDKTPPALFLDVGANFGLYAVRIAARYGCRVWAFEPDRRNFAQLNANLLLNRLLDFVVPVPVAVSSQSRQLALIAAGDDSTGQTRTSPEKVGEGSTVAAVAIDEFPLLDFVPNTTFAAKIDVEGAEPDVIVGMRNLLSQCRGVLQIEVMAVNRERIAAQMAELGYRQVGRIEEDWYFSNL